MLRAKSADLTGRSFYRLAARVQLHAFLADPRIYVVAIFWRLLGLHLRSRSMIEPLAGRSPYAYALWLARRTSDRLPVTAGDKPDHARILVAVDVSQGRQGLSETILSLDQAGHNAGFVLIGDEEGDTWADPRPEEAKADWLCLIRAGDRLAPGALSHYAAAADKTASSLVYADDDLTGPGGMRHTPHFKPDWNADLFAAHDFITHAAIVRLDAAALPVSGSAGPGWARRLVCALIADGRVGPEHLPLILHHRAVRPMPQLLVRSSPCFSAERPSVSVIVPTRNRLDLLRTCLSGLLQTSYEPMDVVVIDNDSDDLQTLEFLGRLPDAHHSVLQYGGPFNFSAMNNFAAQAARGEMLCFLNNDIEIPDPDWLGFLTAQAMRPEVGAVGARLLYGDGSIQHAGVVTGIGGGAAHAHRFLQIHDEGYFSRHNLPQFVSAVTAACLVVRKDRFLAVGGFDEVNFPVAFNDVDLCLRLNARGWQSYYEPGATLIHHESKSRGKDSARGNRVRFATELANLKARWQTDQRIDPFHHPDLSRVSEQFVPAI
jgi:O-antigen biosynthesis protein